MNEFNSFCIYCIARSPHASGGVGLRADREGEGKFLGGEGWASDFGPRRSRVRGGLEVCPIQKWEIFKRRSKIEYQV